MAAIKESIFTTLSSEEFVKYLERNGVEPTPDERLPFQVPGIAMQEGIGFIVGQVDGYAISKTPGK